MTNLISKLKQLNRTRNKKTKSIKLILRTAAADKHFKQQTALPTNPKKIIIMMIGKGIGDAIVMTGLIKALTDKGFQVSILAEPRLNGIFTNHPLIHNHYILHRNGSDINTLSNIKKYQFDILIDLDDIDAHSPLRVKTIKACKPSHSIGVNQFARVYDTSLKKSTSGEHISKRHISIANILGCNIDILEYTVKTTHIEDATALQFIDTVTQPKIVVLNPYGTEESRNMSLEQIYQLSSIIKKNLNIKLIIIGLPDMIKKIPSNDNIIKFHSGNFGDAIALIRHADIVISTDTSIVHLCNALNKKLVCLYNNKISPKGEDNNTLWGPNYANAVQLYSSGNRVDQISHTDIIRATESLLLS